MHLRVVLFTLFTDGGEGKKMEQEEDKVEEEKVEGRARDDESAKMEDEEDGVQKRILEIDE